jgi:hypothetical protein
LRLPHAYGLARFVLESVSRLRSREGRNRWGRGCGFCAMGERYEIRTIEHSGRWVFRLVEAGVGDAVKWESDGKSYLTREDADRAGRLAIAAKLLRSA